MLGAPHWWFLMIPWGMNAKWCMKYFMWNCVHSCEDHSLLDVFTLQLYDTDRNASDNISWTRIVPGNEATSKPYSGRWHDTVVGVNFAPPGTTLAMIPSNSVFRWTASESMPSLWKAVQAFSKETLSVVTFTWVLFWPRTTWVISFPRKNVTTTFPYVQLRPRNMW